MDLKKKTCPKATEARKETTLNGDFKPLHVVLYVILGRYFGMISPKIGMKIYIVYFFNWQTEKKPVLDQ